MRICIDFLKKTMPSRIYSFFGYLAFLACVSYMT